MKKYLKSIIMAVSALVIVAVIIVANVLATTTFHQVLATYLGTKVSVEGSSDIESDDLAYYKSDYEYTLKNGIFVPTEKGTADRKAASQKLSEDIAENGIVLLKNKNGLSYSNDTVFHLFSHSSVDFVMGGTGSGSGAFGSTSLKTAFESANLKINENLWKFYNEGAGMKYKRGTGSNDFGKSLSDYSINECPVSVITADTALVNSFKRTEPAVFVLSRIGGEGSDEPRSMFGNGSVSFTQIEEDKHRHYLEPDSVELGVIDYLNSHFDDVIIIVNANNAMELGWIENYENIKTVLYAPGAGVHGLNAIPRILKGEVNPSGHLVDTFAYDLFSSPASQNADEGLYYPNGNAPDGKNYKYFYYSAYAEGIYVGYRYYETRYEDYVLNQGNAGEYDYAATVQYPFGYGLNLSKFEWSKFYLSEPDANGDVKASVTVTNKSKIAGREVVQLYAQPPYTAGGTEKSSVQLVGFAKTRLLEENGIQNVEITFNIEDLKSYDISANNGAGTYVLDGGKYYVTAATDAHAAVNNILKSKKPELAEKLVPSPSEKAAGNSTLVGEFTLSEAKQYSEGANGTKISNRLSEATRSDITYLSRADWTGTFPSTYRDGLSAIKSSDGNRIESADGNAYINKKT